LLQSESIHMYHLQANISTFYFIKRALYHVLIKVLHINKIHILYVTFYVEWAFLRKKYKSYIAAGINQSEV
jgi:hypothetical protein